MHHDAIVVGGSYAGLSAALMLARARRRVLVIDAGRPRNRFASHAHGVLAQDGRPGHEILADMREQLRAYPTVGWVDGEAVDADGDDGRFVVRTADGGTHRGHKLLLATGVTDVLPAIPGAAERWGRSVLHCPYCHGYEVSPGPLGVIAPADKASHYAGLIADWGEVTLFTNGDAVSDPALLAARGVRVEATPIAGIEGEGDSLDGVRLRDGRLVPLRAVFMASTIEPNGPLAQRLGCTFDEMPMGRILRTDAHKQTTRPGVHAAGDNAVMRGNIMLSAADGVLAGFSIHQMLVMDDAAHG